MLASLLAIIPNVQEFHSQDFTEMRPLRRICRNGMTGMLHTFQGNKTIPGRSAFPVTHFYFVVTGYAREQA